jgi:hypothetical protein
VTTDPQPEKVGMDPLDFEQDTADVAGPEGDLDFGGFFYGFTVTRTVYVSSYPSYAFG